MYCDHVHTFFVFSNAWSYRFDTSMWHENPQNHKDKYTKCVLEALKECEVEVGCP